MPISREPSHYLESVVALTREAGKKILDIYGTDFLVDLKGDDSPLTQADLASHESLVRGLATLHPTHPIISEESTAVAPEIRKAWQSCWMIDPLDGTKEFIKRNGEFTVNVALIFDRQPVLGVVYAPVLDLTYFAAEGCGAYKQSGDEVPEPIRVRDRRGDRLTVVGSRSHQTEELMQYLTRLGDHDLTSMGSSLKLCLVAEGAADIYPRIGLTSEWDTAAAHCVVREAGGRVTDLKGQELRYNERDTFLNPYFLAFGDKTTDWCQYAEGIAG
ncbi:3'(2'),5'-bisphosphate nucleotidase CysQ [Methylotetracoccus oryzae]|uniref:3'(2'),5'-bisphosphate nucleotidase CysQ n=1 Tax=Methylotetracoccus oryzae TaxID=1919059 RepID=UPI00111A3BB2|nr:3'(2'),5'-bisphosphate nucleotidase CysQ [Methylotetracoccus oryzae]